MAERTVNLGDIKSEFSYTCVPALLQNGGASASSTE